MRPLDSALEEAILSLLATRAPGKTICPSEAAKHVANSSGTPQTWPSLMDSTRAAALRLVDQGRIVITQRGRPIELASAHGPIRLKLSS